MKSVIGGTTTAFVGTLLEWSGSSSTMKKYYYAGSERIAMRTGSSTLNYILGDHLGSASVTTDSAGNNAVYALYKPWGESRYNSGALPTKYTYTGQYSNMSDFGLMYYNARYYDPALGRFTSADTLIPEPGNPQSWDRYAYVRNNPLRYTDPSGHFPWPVLFAAAVVGGCIIGGYVAQDIVQTSAIEMPRTNPPTNKNVTRWLTEQLNENASSSVPKVIRENWNSKDPVRMIAATKAWVGLVRGGAAWDYKPDLAKSNVLERGNPKVIIGSSSSNFETQVNFQAVANLNYGAMGRECGFPLWFLEMGAGAFQFYDNVVKPKRLLQPKTWKQHIGTVGTFFDDPFDNYMINAGYSLAEEYDLSNLTDEQLIQFYQQYSLDHGAPPNPLAEGY